MLFFILVCSTLEKGSHKKNLVFGEPCIFPWKELYTNLTHQGCANPDQDEGGLWCPTQLDEDGYFATNNQYQWGYCDENCNYSITTAELIQNTIHILNNYFIKTTWYILIRQPMWWRRKFWWFLLQQCCKMWHRWRQLWLWWWLHWRSSLWI